MREHARLPAALSLGLVLALAACNLNVAVPSAPITLDAVGDVSLDAIPEIMPIVGLGVGEACVAPGECRPGLTCPAGACAPAGSLPEGTPCLLSA